MPLNYIPKTETEKALQESLRQLELQCKERVDLLEALQESRKEAAANDEGTDDKESSSMKPSGVRAPKLEKGKRPSNVSNVASSNAQGWIGDGTIPAVDYTDLSKPPPLPGRPSSSTTTAVPSSSVTLKSAGSLELRETAPSTSSPHRLSPSPVPALSPSPGTTLTKESSRGSSPERRKIMLTTLRQKKDSKKPKYKSSSSSRTRPAASKAAGLAWGTTKKQSKSVPTESSDSDPRRDLEQKPRLSSEDVSRNTIQQKVSTIPFSSDRLPSSVWREPAYPDQAVHVDSASAAASKSLATDELSKPQVTTAKPPIKSLPPPKYPVYRKEYLSQPTSASPDRIARAPPLNRSTSATYTPTSMQSPSSPPGATSEQLARRTLAKSQSTPRNISNGMNRASVSPTSGDEPALQSSRRTDAGFDGATGNPPSRKPKPPPPRRKPRITPPSSDQDSAAGEDSSSEPGDENLKLRNVMRKLPKGIDVNAAKQILNDIVVRGDEVHWDDVAGLETAKKALKEAVVYPFLRPDLFMGLREPARGMLLFGPPGTGKTMLARAVATESKSTFFSVSASTLTSKWHGESEKLVRALFGLAKVLAPSIIFVDEIDSLLSTRSSGTEHEASRRSKTEFLIQWSDLQRAAAGRNYSPDKSGNDGGGDASRVLVLAATNLPWDIDEAARRRFVRRQYIPLPEDHVREQQIRRLLSHQTHEMSNEDIEVLVKVTEGTQQSPNY